MKDGTCHVCGAHVPVWYVAEWCDDCIDAFQASGLATMEEFIDSRVDGTNTQV